MLFFVELSKFNKNRKEEVNYGKEKKKQSKFEIWRDFTGRKREKKFDPTILGQNVECER